MFGVATVLDLRAYYPMCRSLYKGHSELAMVVWAFLSSLILFPFWMWALLWLSLLLGGLDVPIQSEALLTGILWPAFSFSVVTYTFIVSLSSVSFLNQHMWTHSQSLSLILFLSLSHTHTRTHTLMSTMSFQIKSLTWKVLPPSTSVTVTGAPNLWEMTLFGILTKGWARSQRKSLLFLSLFKPLASSFAKVMALWGFIFPFSHQTWTLPLIQDYKSIRHIPYLRLLHYL